MIPVLSEGPKLKDVAGPEAKRELNEVARCINVGEDAEAYKHLANWRRLAAEDCLAELAAKGPHDLLCGEDPINCTGRVEVLDVILDCPLREDCAWRGEGPDGAH